MARQEDQLPIAPPPGAAIKQITACAGSGGETLFALCTDGSVWRINPNYMPRWTLVVSPGAETPKR
jgi:hypothetical protein